ncbi:unnamed protein product [Schistosoma mattheei]|uniref:Uncharacterized protein n=1 Tax=Schistosoma mattheei TaxID=31246 RepID=A0A3P8CCG6_9TREM|nr:unnamed protein product [Schistosoma mattheei]
MISFGIIVELILADFSKRSFIISVLFIVFGLNGITLK